MNKKLVSLILVAALQACGGGGSSSAATEEESNNDKPTILTPAQKVAQMEDSGELPKLERGESLQGIDANDNGVRDDIEAYLSKKYPQPELKAPALNLAKAIQSSLAADLENKDAVRGINNVMTLANSCIYETVRNNKTDIRPSQLTKEIESITTNTKSRLLAYLDFSTASSGMVFTHKRDGNCE